MGLEWPEVEVRKNQGQIARSNANPGGNRHGQDRDGVSVARGQFGTQQGINVVSIGVRAAQFARRWNDRPDSLQRQFNRSRTELDGAEISA